MARTRHNARKAVGQPAPPVNLADLTGEEVAPAHETPAVVAPSDETLPTEDHARDPWCAGCSNGGRLVDCSYCRSRSACDVCVPITQDADLLDFMCPVCHMEKHANNPYFAFWRGNAPATTQPTEIACLESRGWFARADPTPLAIISFKLASVIDRSYPPRAVLHHLETCFHDDQRQRRTFEFFEFTFSFSSKNAIKTFRADMISLSRHLKAQGFQRALVFLVTHSDPDRGDLHCSVGSACTVNELFEALLPAPLRSQLKKMDSIFVLLACGAAIRHQSSLDSILDLASSGIFRATIGFSSHHFQPPRANCFLMKFSEKYFFRRYSLDPALKASLSEEAGLGAHGNVTIISKENTGQWVKRIYVWSHVASRPWGTDVSQQCPTCKRLRPWAKPKVSSRSMTRDCKAVTVQAIEHSCRYCSYSRRFVKPDALIRDGVMAECGRGEWYFMRHVLSNHQS